MLAVKHHRLHPARSALAHAGTGCLNGGAGVAEADAILGALGAGDAGCDATKVQCQSFAIDGRFGRGHSSFAVQTLATGVGLNQGDLLIRTPCQVQVFKCFAVNRKNSAGCTVFGCHVGDSCLVGKRQVIETVTEKLDKFSDHSVLTQHLDHTQHQVGRSCSLRQRAGQFDSHYLGNKHRHRLSQHSGFSLYSAHTPAQHTQAVDHGGMGIRTHYRIWVGPGNTSHLTTEHNASEIFDIYLVHDTGSRWHHAKVTESTLTPAQKRIALTIAGIF